MSEYWKSTPKYWCKHCSIYVRDTGLERKNHESTAKHQSALKRFLRDIHRDHEKEQREKDRAKREVERLNGVVGGGGAGPSGSSGSSSVANKGSASAASTSSASATQEQRQKQWEQLAEMGIDVPTELRPDMAMAGTWTVTNTRVVDDDDDAKVKNIDAIAVGTRKRVKPEANEDDERAEEEEKAVQGLFKKPRKWGHDTKQAPEDDAELDALLSGTLAPKMPKKEEEEEANDANLPKAKTEAEEPEKQAIKKEEPEEDQLLESAVSAAAEPGGDSPVKKEDPGEAAAGADTPVVVFKKRKGKENMRQKKPLKP